MVSEKPYPWKQFNRNLSSFTLCGHHTVTETGCFVKEGDVLHSQFWRFQSMVPASWGWLPDYTLAWRQNGKEMVACRRKQTPWLAAFYNHSPSWGLTQPWDWHYPLMTVINVLKDSRWPPFFKNSSTSTASFIFSKPSISWLKTNY